MIQNRKRVVDSINANNWKKKKYQSLTAIEIEAIGKIERLYNNYCDQKFDSEKCLKLGVWLRQAQLEKLSLDYITESCELFNVEDFIQKLFEISRLKESKSSLFFYCVSKILLDTYPLISQLFFENLLDYNETEEKRKKLKKNSINNKLKELSNVLLIFIEESKDRQNLLNSTKSCYVEINQLSSSMFDVLNIIQLFSINFCRDLIFLTDENKIKNYIGNLPNNVYMYLEMTKILFVPILLHPSLLKISDIKLKSQWFNTVQIININFKRLQEIVKSPNEIFDTRSTEPLILNGLNYNKDSNFSWLYIYIRAVTYECLKFLKKMLSNELNNLFNFNKSESHSNDEIYQTLSNCLFCFISLFSFENHSKNNLQNYLWYLKLPKYDENVDKYIYLTDSNNHFMYCNCSNNYDIRIPEHVAISILYPHKILDDDMLSMLLKFIVFFDCVKPQELEALITELNFEYINTSQDTIVKKLVIDIAKMLKKSHQA